MTTAPVPESELLTDAETHAAIALCHALQIPATAGTLFVIIEHFAAWNRRSAAIAPTAVKALVWKDMTYKGVEEWLAHHAFGSFTVQYDKAYALPFVLRPFIAGPSNFATADEAKAAAQADYEARILSALSPTETPWAKDGATEPVQRVPPTGTAMGQDQPTVPTAEPAPGALIERLANDAKLLRSIVDEYNRSARGIDAVETELWAIAARIERAADRLAAANDAKGTPMEQIHLNDVNLAVGKLVNQNACMSTVSGDGKPYVKITFPTRNEVNQFVDGLRAVRAWADDIEFVARDRLAAANERADAAEQARDRLHANPADFRYWEGRWRDADAALRAAEARIASLTEERDLAVTRADKACEAHESLQFEMAARIARLTEALRENFCPRPANGRPDQFDVGDCVDAGECGCMNRAALNPGNQTNGL